MSAPLKNNVERIYERVRSGTVCVPCDQEHLGQVVKVFAAAMPTAKLSEKLQLCTEECAGKMKAILMQMQSSVPADVLAKAWGVLGAEQQAALQAAMA